MLFLNRELTWWAIGSLCFAIASVSSAAGAGGGPILLSVLILVLNLSLDVSSVISPVLITCSMFSVFLTNIKLKHPEDRLQPCINWGLTLFALPVMLIGSTFGVILNQISPSWFINLVLILFLVWGTYKTFFKGVKRYKAETEQLKARIFVTNTIYGRPHIPAKLFLKLVSMWMVLIVVSILKNVFPKCSSLWWLLQVLFWPIIALVYCYYGYLHLQEQVVADLDMSPSKAFGILFTVFFLSALSALCGLGGGSALAVLFSAVFELHPRVMSATCATMVFFSASATTIQFAFLNAVEWDIAIPFMVVMTISAFLGLKAVDYFVKKTHRSSIIVFIVVVMLLVSLVLLSYTGIKHTLSVYNETHELPLFNMDDLC
ncbi:hypothetical protein PCE1_002560 [Barthelona sp. PCE]